METADIKVNEYQPFMLRINGIQMTIRISKEKRNPRISEKYPPLCTMVAWEVLWDKPLGDTTINPIVTLTSGETVALNEATGLKRYIESVENEGYVVVPYRYDRKAHSLLIGLDDTGNANGLGYISPAEAKRLNDSIGEMREAIAAEIEQYSAYIQGKCYEAAWHDLKTGREKTKYIGTFAEEPRLVIAQIEDIVEGFAPAIPEEPKAKESERER